MSLWLLVAAAAVGFAAAWLAFEARRAWSLEPARDPSLVAESRPVTEPIAAGPVAPEIPELRAEIAELRRSLAWLQNELSAATRAARKPAASQPPPAHQPPPAPQPEPPRAPAPPPPPPAPAPSPAPVAPPPRPEPEPSRSSVPPVPAMPAAIPGERRVFDRGDAPFRRG